MKSLRRRQLVLAAAILFASTGTTNAQVPRPVRVGYLSSNPARDTETAIDAFRSRMRELGHVENQNLVIESRYAQGEFAHLPMLAAELVQLKVDVIFVYGTPAALAAKNATKTIPIVFGGVNDPLTVGLVPSLRKPGGNVTGVTTNNTELSAMRLGLMKTAIPTVSRVAILANPEFKPTVNMLAEMRHASQKFGVQLSVFEARDPGEILTAFTQMREQKADALMVLPDPWFLSQRSLIASLAMNNRIPAMYHLQQYLEVGGLMSYGATYTESFQQGAVLVDKILRGRNPADLPVEQPWHYELAINLKTMRALGLKMPPDIMVRATRIIQ